MSEIHRNNSNVVDLLQCFFRESERHFRFLEQEHSYSYISELTDYKDQYKIITPYHNQDVQGQFLAMTRYERGHQAIEFLFGENNFLLEGYVYYDRVKRFELSEILATKSQDNQATMSSTNLTTTQGIEQLIQKIATTLKQHIEHYTNADEAFLEQASTMRNKRIEHSIRKHFQNQIIEACKVAANAFLQKDYFQVIALLQPLELYLESTDLQKLKFARKYLQS